MLSSAVISIRWNVSIAFTSAVSATTVRVAEHLPPLCLLYHLHLPQLVVHQFLCCLWNLSAEKWYSSEPDIDLYIILVSTARSASNRFGVMFLTMYAGLSLPSNLSCRNPIISFDDLIWCPAATSREFVPSQFPKYDQPPLCRGQVFHNSGWQLIFWNQQFLDTWQSWWCTCIGESSYHFNQKQVVALLYLAQHFIKDNINEHVILNEISREIWMVLLTATIN